MAPDRFEHLLSLAGPRITKTNAKMREAISAAERLTLMMVMTIKASASHIELAEKQ